MLIKAIKVTECQNRKETQTLWSRSALRTCVWGRVAGVEFRVARESKGSYDQRQHGARFCLFLLHASSVYLEILFSCLWQQNIRGKRRDKGREREMYGLGSSEEWGKHRPLFTTWQCSCTACLRQVSSGYCMSRKFHCHHHPQWRKDSTRYPYISLSSFYPTNPNNLFMIFPP